MERVIRSLVARLKGRVTPIPQCVTSLGIGCKGCGEVGAQGRVERSFLPMSILPSAKSESAE